MSDFCLTYFWEEFCVDACEEGASGSLDWLEDIYNKAMTGSLEKNRLVPYSICIISKKSK